MLQEQDKPLFEALRAKRLSLSKAQNIAPFIIFHDKTLRDMATHKPQSLEQFEISDERPTEEIAKMLKTQGFEVVWKDWEGFN